MVADAVQHAFETLFPPWAVVLLLAFTPVVEVRASIPVGYAYRAAGEMGWFGILFWSLLGSLLIIPVAFWVLPVLERVGRQWGRLGTLMDWVFARARRKGKKAERAGMAGLFAIVALPLPGAGTWTACIAAYVLGIPLRRALGTILAGIAVEIAIVAGVVYSGAKAWQWLAA
jgi:uncharacterized membrane protein